jgi:CobQ-like glutamine amidotransferase family enzyme
VTSASSLTVVVVYPDLLGTYGDGGNGLILARRAAWRGIDTTLVQAPSDRHLPAGDIYCVGGGEDGPEVRAAATLIGEGTLVRAVEEGAVVLGVCAGYQLIGRQFPDAAGHPHDGVGLLDVTTDKGTGPRAVGELSARVLDGAPSAIDGMPLPRLSGFENHGGVTTVGPGAAPLAEVVSGVGNGGGDGTEGAWNGRVVGTYLHGPVLARNVALADLLLGWAVGSGPDAARLAPLDDTEEDALRAERLAAVSVGRSPTGSRWGRRLRPAQ